MECGCGSCMAQRAHRGHSGYTGYPKSLEDQEKRDRVPRGTYASAIRRWSMLEVAEGLKVQPPSLLWSFIMERWGRPQLVICDRFRLAELEDAIQHQARIEPRVTRWS